MSEIQRYLNNAVTNYPLLRRDDGEYILYADHEAALRQRDERIAELEKALKGLFASHCLNAAHGESCMCPVCRDAFVLLEAK